VAEPAGVRGAVLVEASPWIEDNDWVLDLVANEPFICAVVGNLDPEAAEFPTLLERFARNTRFRGIRIRQGRPLAFEHPQLRGNLQALAAMRCTMEVVMRGADLERLAHLAAEMPGLRIMLNHLAFVKMTGEPPDAAWVAAMERFSGLPNVFCKVSRFTEQAAIQPAPLDAAYYAPVFDVVWAVFGPTVWPTPGFPALHALGDA
jgi:L-fuconolactonase